MKHFETLAVGLEHNVATIALNRPDKANAINAQMWKELKDAFQWIDATPEARVGILSSNGKHFCAGIDLEFLMSLNMEVNPMSEGRKQERMKQIIEELQATISAAEKCRKPILAEIHGSCIGGAIDLITACDMRYATKESKFSVKEADLAIVADIGTLQRLPTIVGEGVARELAFTARTFDGVEAASIGLINKVFSDEPSLTEFVTKMAQDIAKKSPLTMRGIKESLNYSRDHSVDEGLAAIATRNAAMLLSEDVQEAAMSQMEKRDPKFKD